MLSSMSVMTNPFYGPTPFPPEVPHLLSYTPDRSWFTPELQLSQFRGKGDLWNVFSAHFTWLTTVEDDLIVKFCNLTAFPERSYGDYEYSRTTARAALRHEVIIYGLQLSTLQGKVVPRFFGLLGSRQPGDNQCWAALFEDVGESLTPSDNIHPGIRYVLGTAMLLR